MKYGYYSKIDLNEEIIAKTLAFSRLQAAKMFAFKKNLTLKQFLNIYTIKEI
jgi:hypothetical protein